MEYLRQRQLTPNLVQYILHSIAMVTDTTTTLETSTVIRSYATQLHFALVLSNCLIPPKKQGSIIYGSQLCSIFIGKGMFFVCLFVCFCRVCRQRKCLLTHWGAMVTLHFSSQYLEVGNCPRHSAGTQSHDCHMILYDYHVLHHMTCRLCAVYGGVYCLHRHVTSIISSTPENTISSIVCSSGQKIKCS